MGSGLAWLDYDNDGWMDLYVVQSAALSSHAGGAPRAQDRLYRNNGDGTFTDVTREGEAEGHALTAWEPSRPDYDNDGFTDLYVTNYGKNILYRNNGDGTFTDVTDRAGVAPQHLVHERGLRRFRRRRVPRSLRRCGTWTTPARKTYFCGDRATGQARLLQPEALPAARTTCSSTTTATARSPTSRRPSGLDKALGKGLGVVVADVDDDGRPDIYVANDTTMNFLFHNLGGNRFEDVSLLSGAALTSAGTPIGGMGVNAGDLDGHGQARPRRRELRGGDRTASTATSGQRVFEDVVGHERLRRPSFTFSGFGLNLFDAANAGRLDAFIANGHVLERCRVARASTAAPAAVPDVERRRREVPRAGLRRAVPRELDRARLAVADYDNDGDLDIAVSNSGGPLELLRNDGTHGNWIGFVLRGNEIQPPGNRRARHDRDRSRQRQVREVKAGRATSPPRATRASTSAWARSPPSNASPSAGPPESSRTLPPPAPENTNPVDRTPQRPLAAERDPGRAWSVRCAFVSQRPTSASAQPSRLAGAGRESPRG